MKFVVNSNILTEAVLSVSKALPVRTTVPVLEGILIEAKGGFVTLTCSDLLLQKEARFAAIIDEEGFCAVKGKLFNELCRKLPMGSATIGYENKVMKIVCANSSNRLPGIEFEKYPLMRFAGKAKSLAIKPERCRDLISRCSFAVAADDPARPFLTGVCLDVKPEGVNFVATDSYHFALRRYLADSVPETGKCIVPGKAINEIARMSEGSEEDVVLNISPTHIRFDNGHECLTARLIDGEYLDYERLLPKECSTRVFVKRDEIMEAIDRAQLIAREGANNIKFEIKEDSMTVKAESIAGTLEEEFEVQVIGDPISIAFNPKYCMNVLKAIEDEKVILEFMGPFRPCAVKPIHGNEYIYLLVPVRA